MGEQSISPNQNGFHEKNEDIEMNDEMESDDEEEEEEQMSPEGRFIIFSFSA